MKSKWLLIIGLVIVGILGFSFFSPKRAVLTENKPTYLWQVQSVDTMKTSRDKARAHLHDLKFDTEIEKELLAIKNLGANYVAVDTPYDDEFLPYLKRWVSLARKTGLHVWFRGNWSNWEGWFGYPKNLTPSEHHAKTAEFIETHPDLFEDEDIFDPCPECENVGFWKQPEDNAKYNEFIRNQHVVVTQSFKRINKKVHTNFFSIIGGRAKEVLTQETANALGNIITIDHYIKDPTNMGEYINYFSNNLRSKTLVGEFGAPIPDIHGSVTEDKQAQIVEALLHQMYKYKDSVYGVNYYVLTEGTSKLLNDDGTPRQVVEVVKNYFIPGVVKGTVTNTLGDRLKDISVKTGDDVNITTTDREGYFSMVIPASTVDIIVGGNKYKITEQKEVISRGSEITKNVVLEPQKIDFIYRVRLILHNLKKKFFDTTS